MNDGAIRVPITFGPAYAVLSTALFLPPSSAFVDLSGDLVHVRMGWAFRCTFPRAAVVSAVVLQRKPFNRGVHGFAGRWLVNGSGLGILSIDLRPPQRAYVLGFPIRLRQLMVSVADPSALAGALGMPIRGMRAG